MMYFDVYFSDLWGFNQSKVRKLDNTCTLTHLFPPSTYEENDPQCTAWIYTDYYGMRGVGPSLRRPWGRMQFS